MPKLDKKGKSKLTGARKRLTTDLKKSVFAFFVPRSLIDIASSSRQLPRAQDLPLNPCSFAPPPLKAAGRVAGQGLRGPPGE